MSAPPPHRPPTRRPPPIGELEGFADRYEILSPVGRGGMGHVYEGRLRATGERVAIKVMNAERGGDSTTAKRFAREAKMLGTLRHPNIVRCLEHGISPNGLAYIVMEFAEGRTVRQILDESRRLSEPVALDIALQVCAALEQAHDQGILHRDVKGANVVVASREGRPLVKLVDFGVGKRLSSASESTLTRPGHFVGSYEHCSPEQLTGRELDGRSDIYSFGVLLFEMLTGSAPFPTASLEQLFLDRLTLPVPPFRAVAPEARVSERTEEAVRRCLAKHPDRRWQSITVLRMELEECRREAQVAPRGQPVPGEDGAEEPVTITYVRRDPAGDASDDDPGDDPDEPVTLLHGRPEPAAMPASRGTSFGFLTTLLVVVIASAAVAFGVVAIWLLLSSE